MADTGLSIMRYEYCLHRQPDRPRPTTLLPPRSNGKPEAATAVDKLLMMGIRMPETCWAVLKRQAIKLRDWCIWFVDLSESPIISDEFIIFQLSQWYVVDIANISTKICSVYGQNLCLFATCLSIYSDNSLWVDWQERRPTRACAITH
jgi:hypothetical protein